MDKFISEIAITLLYFCIKEGSEHMATKNFQVVSYEVQLTRELIYGVPQVKCYALILCNCGIPGPFGFPMPTGDRFCIYFLRPDGGDHKNEYIPANKWASVFLPVEQYSWYIDLLRNERPVFAYVNSNKPERNRLYTGKEPVGEEES